MSVGDPCLVRLEALQGTFAERTIATAASMWETLEEWFNVEVVVVASDVNDAVSEEVYSSDDLLDCGEEWRTVYTERRGDGCEALSPRRRRHDATSSLGCNTEIQERVRRKRGG